MIFPDRPTGNFWQLAGSALTQGGEQANVLQDLVTRRTAAALEQKRIQDELAQRDWEFKQKQDQDAKEETARAALADLAKNGVTTPASTETIPGKTETVSGPSPDMLDLQAGRPNALMGYNSTPTQSQVTTPDQTVTTTASNRPATMADYQAAILPTVDPATYVKNLTPPNKAAALTAVKTFILQAKAAGNKIIKSSDLDAAALAGDPTGAILTDKAYDTFKKTYANDAQSQNSESLVTKNGIMQQNADTNAQRGHFMTPYQQASLDRLNSMPPGGAMGSAMNTRALLTDSRAARMDYEKAAKPFLALKAIKNSPSYGTGLGDQSMIDKLIIIETGKVPTEAQYFQVAKNLGIADKIDKVTGRLLTGEIMGPEARKNLELQAEEQMKLTHSAYQDDLSQFGDMAKENGVNPNAVSRHGGYYDSVDKYLNGEDPGPAALRPIKKTAPPSGALKPSKDPLGLF